MGDFTWIAREKASPVPGLSPQTVLVFQYPSV